MPIPFKSVLSSVIANATWLDKTVDDEKKGKLGLFKVANTDADAIEDVQQYINDVADSDGTIGENDANRKIYSNAQIINNGDNRKVAIGKLDAQVKVNLDVNDGQDIILDDHETRISTNETNISANATNISTNDDDILAIQDSVGSANGIAPLNASTKIDGIYLPSYVDDVEEYADLASFPVTGETGKIYVALDTNKTYRWSGSVYTEISPSDVNSVNGYTGIVTLTKSDISLDNVTNDSQLKRESADFDSFDEKTIPVNDDIVLIEDFEDSFAKKKVRLENLLGGGSGGGGSFAWELNQDISPIENTFNGMSCVSFDYESNQAISALVTVPESYELGAHIVLQNALFLPSGNQDNVLFKLETTLFKSGENVLSDVNTHSSINQEITVSTPGELTEIGLMELTTNTGEINSIAVEPYDMLKVVLKRDNDNETISSQDDANFFKYSSTLNFKYKEPPLLVPPPSGSLTWNIEGLGVVTTTTSSIEKTGGGASWNVALQSNEGISSGNGFVEWQHDQFQYVLGLESTVINPTGSYTTIDFALTIDATGIYRVQNGTVVSIGTSPNLGDKFKVAIEGNDIVYYRDTGAGYVEISRTISATINYPMFVGASFNGIGAKASLINLELT